MQTKMMEVNEERSYEIAADYLNNGEVVAFPTETVYGLGAVATNQGAVTKIFEAKGRPSDNPLIVHIGSKEEVEKYAVEVPAHAKVLMEHFWPGPLTLIMKVKPGVLAENVTAGLDTVGIRMPDHPVALKLLQTVKQPVAAPSANRSGKPSPTEAEHVYHDLEGKIPLILNGGATGIGVESTVLDVTTATPVILRPGGVTKEMLEEIIGPVEDSIPFGVGEKEAPRAPGMKYQHYAPDSPVYLIEQNYENIEQAISELHNDGKKVAFIGPDAFLDTGADWFFSTGSLEDLSEFTKSLYAALRACDDTEADVILATATKREGVGAAIMNRLEKAADRKWYKLAEE
ncbi:L-threonylcarbamoyladenylate synthase [Chungangia koreensis]|uniref:Threonylcarbamoyl-AMP synthase n=1 Tax=Chungangia koreensis TaxID=752657 RepID=A0ABV8X415_9LACT